MLRGKRFGMGVATESFSANFASSKERRITPNGTTLHWGTRGGTFQDYFSILT